MKTIFLALLAFLAACQARPSSPVASAEPLTRAEQITLSSLLQEAVVPECQVLTRDHLQPSACKCAADVAAARATRIEYDLLLRTRGQPANESEAGVMRGLVARIQPDFNRQCVRAGP